MVSGTIETMGTMLAGQTADAFCASIAHADLLSIGLNCATGPEFMTDHIRTHQRDVAGARVLLSERRVCRTRRASTWRRRRRWRRSSSVSCDHGWLNIVGGCCGTTDAHIKAIAQMAEGKRPRVRASAGASRLLTPASNWWRPTRATGR